MNVFDDTKPELTKYPASYQIAKIAQQALQLQRKDPRFTVKQWAQMIFAEYQDTHKEK